MFVVFWYIVFQLILFTYYLQIFVQKLVKLTECIKLFIVVLFMVTHDKWISRLTVIFSSVMATLNKWIIDRLVNQPTGLLQSWFVFLPPPYHNKYLQNLQATRSKGDRNVITMQELRYRPAKK